MPLALVAIASAAVGVAIGVLSGLLGIGGGSFMVPIFSLGFGMAAIEATATSLFIIIPTSLSGAIAHIRNKTCIVGVGVAAGIGGALTSPVGVLLASASPDWAIMAGTAIVIAYSAINMFRKAFKLRAEQRAEAASGVGAAPTAAHACSAALTATTAGLQEVSAQPQPQPQPQITPEFKVTRQVAIRAALIGVVAGVLSGYVGLGGGFLMIPMFIGILGLPMKRASGTSLIAVILLAVPGAIAQAALGNIDWLVGLMVAAGSIPGAILGARFVGRVPELSLRFAFGTVLLVASVMLVVNQVL